MIACLTPEAVPAMTNEAPDWHAKFLELLPAIRRYARRSFADLPPQARWDAVDEATANALVAFARLVELGKAELAYATPLAAYAVKQVRDGRSIGRRRNVRDVMSVIAQRRKGFRIECIHDFDAKEGAWREILIEDKRSTPADTAISRIDFAAWLGTLAPRHRRIAKVLATNESTGAAAKRFRLSSGRISQIRQELRAAWQRFQGEAMAAR